MESGFETTDLGLRHYRMFIGGQWVDTAETYDVKNPATGAVVARSAKATVDHVDAAVDAARGAFEQGRWRRMAPLDRAAVIERAAAILEDGKADTAATITAETGLPIRSALAVAGEVPVAHLRYFAGLTRTFEWTRPTPIGGAVLHSGLIKKEPLGVCAGICPWNLPASISVWKSVPALAAGNSVVLKADEKAPSFPLKLAGALRDAGLPDGVLNVLVGDGPVVGEHLVKHPDVRMVSFTGSTPTGRRVMTNAAQAIKRVHLELGGKSPSLVLDDADIDLAVDGTIYGFAFHAGQSCESGTRLLVHSSIHDEFVNRLVARLKSVKMGDPMDPATDVGPLMTEAQRDRVLDYVEIGLAEGARLVCGGGVPEGAEFRGGFWVEPTVFVDVTNSMRIARDEIFGPVLSVIAYDTVEEAIAIANDSDYGLAAGVWSRDNQRALAVADQLDAGSVWVNDWHNISEHLPFGGYKQSGIGRELGPNALAECVQEKSITVDMSGDLDRRAYSLVLGTPLAARL